MALLSEVQERSWATDKYGDKVKSFQWDWRDDRIMAWITNFPRIGKENTLANIDRLKLKNTGRLRRSVFWKTWAASGGDSQVFEARYIYYAKFAELAVGRGEPYNGPVPDIPHRHWGAIPVPTRKRKGKPHVVAEMRTQAAKFATMARKEFSFVGTIYLIYAMGNNKSTAAAVNRALFWRNKREKFTRI